MTTLAQIYLEHGTALRSGLPTQVHELIKDSLSTLADDATERVKLCAELYVFDEDPTKVCGDLVNAGSLTQTIINDTVRLPSNVTWIEWRVANEDHPDFRVGALLAKGIVEDKEEIAVCFIGGFRKEPFLAKCFGMLVLPQLPLAKKDKIRFGFWKEHDQWPEDQEARTDIRQWLLDIYDALFLIVTPRVCEVRYSEHSPRLQMRRTKAGKLPLVEYKKMVLRVGVGQPRYVRVAQSPAELIPGTPSERHHRLHRVCGHFRTYRKGRELPMATFVPMHWRGDAELGIVLHERRVIK